MLEQCGVGFNAEQKGESWRHSELEGGRTSQRERFANSWTRLSQLLNQKSLRAVLWRLAANLTIWVSDPDWFSA